MRMPAGAKAHRAPRRVGGVHDADAREAEHDVHALQPADVVLASLRDHRLLDLRGGDERRQLGGKGREHEDARRVGGRIGRVAEVPAPRARRTAGRRREHAGHEEDGRHASGTRHARVVARPQRVGQDAPRSFSAPEGRGRAIASGV